MELVRHASERLAQAIVLARWHTCDPRTFAEWGKATAHTAWQLAGVVRRGADSRT